MASADVPPEEVADVVRRRMRADRIPGLSVAVMAAGALRWTAGYGLADLSTGAPVRPETAFLVRHLLNHSSGLANPLPIRWVYPATSRPPDRREFVEKLLRRHRRLRAEPGERAHYSNLGYLVLGEVIAEAGGRSYEHYVHQRILEPLGMRHTGFAYQPDALSPPAVGYQRLARGLTPLLRAGSSAPCGSIPARAPGWC